MTQIINRISVINAIDEVMNNREIDSIRNAILAIRDKVLEIPTEQKVTGDLMREVCQKCNDMKDERECCPFGYPCEQVQQCVVCENRENKYDAWDCVLSSIEFGDTDLMLYLWRRRQERMTR